MRHLLVYLLSLLGVFVGYVQCQSADGKVLPKSAEIYHWRLTAPQPSLLAKIAYNPDTLESNVLSYTPPSEDADETLYRIGFFTNAADGSKQWVGSLAKLDTQQKKNDNVLQLYLSPSHQHELYHVSLSKSDSENLSESIGVELLHPEAGAVPELNKPVVISPDGSNPEEVVEKTFFQKYWWVILIVSVLAMSGGGGEGQ